MHGGFLFVYIYIFSVNARRINESINQAVAWSHAYYYINLMKSQRYISKEKNR